MNDHLVGKILKATSNVLLTACNVDGTVYSSSDIFIPEIFKHSFVRVKSVDGDVITLENLSSDDWNFCEVSIQDIEEFKVKSNIEI